MNYDTIKEEIKNIDITLPPPQEEPERQYYFIKKMQHWMEEKKSRKGQRAYMLCKYIRLPDECEGFGEDNRNPHDHRI